MEICNTTKLECTKCNPVCEHRVSFKCPVDYDINKCSSKEYGLTCETCFHTEDKEYKNKSLDKLIEIIANMKSLTRR